MHSCLGSNYNKEPNQLHGKVPAVLLGVEHVVVAEVVVVVDGVGLIKDLQNPLPLVPEMRRCYRSNNNNGQVRWLVSNVVRMQIEIVLGDKSRMLEKEHSSVMVALVSLCFHS